MRELKLSIIIPVFNERQTFRKLLGKVEGIRLENILKEIIVVDDGSQDGTRELLNEIPATPHLKIVTHEKNRGKGAALRTGFSLASGDILLIQDSDLEYDPEEYPKLLEPILAGKADVVYGSRFLSGPHRVLFFWHSVGNKILTLLSNMMSDLNLTDMETGYKVFKKEVVGAIRLQSNRFGFEPEFTIKAARRGFRFYEVPISYDGRSYAQGKKITWRDGLTALWTIVQSRFSS